MKVAITGISGRFGRLLAGRLHREHTVVGLDRRPCRSVPKDVEVHRIDIRRKRCEKIFRDNHFDAVIHLNVIHDPRASSAEHFTFNIQGTDRVMAHCAKHGVKKVIILSSANVYGPRPDNTQFLNEDSPLMGGERFSGIQDLINLDMLAQSFFWKYPHIETVILRPVHIVGAVRNAPSNYLRLKRPWRVSGYDPLIQIIHEEDLARAIALALGDGIQGIFNIHGCEPTPLSHLHTLSEAEPVSIPHLIAQPALARLFSMRLTSFPAPELDHLRYVCMVDASRAESAMAYRPQFDLAETMAHLRLSRIFSD